MSLRQQQSDFAKALGMLIAYAYSLGYEMTLEEGFVSSGTGHIDGSFHYKKLAQDINLFKDGKYLTATTDHATLGIYWERLGGTWGGRWNDGNHYSWGEV